MKTIDFDNIKACDLTDGDGLLEAYKTYLQEVLEYSEFEAEIAATDMENPYDAPFVLQEYEGNFTIDGIEYEVRACHTDFCYCGLFYLSDVQPFEFYMLFDTSTMSDGTVGGYSSETKKYLI